MNVNVSKVLLLAVLAALAWAGISNFSDEAHVRALADETACLGVACRAELQKKTRDLFGWTFKYLTYGDRTRALEVTCMRPLWLFGAYRCDVSVQDSAVDERFRRPR